MSLRGKVTLALYAQVAGQVLTAGATLVHLLEGLELEGLEDSIWILAPLVAAVLVPFRHDGSPRDRATGNFAAAWLVAGVCAWEALLGVGDLFGTPGSGTGVFVALTLVASVLHSGAGSVFWTLRDRPSD